MAPPLAAGTVLGARYVLHRCRARGGVAEVWEAEDPRLHRRVAVKVLQPEVALDPVVRARFRREAVAAARLNHPNVIAIYDVLAAAPGAAGTTGDGTADPAAIDAIVMELVPGHSLRTEIDLHGPLPGERIIEIALQITAGLGVAHDAELVHRDVKPGNVLLRPDGRVVVTDFGIAKALDVAPGLTDARTVVGTARYLAPEQVRGRPVDRRTDLYALGLVLWECATGRQPYTGETLEVIARARLQGPPPPLATVAAGLPAGLADLVDDLLADDPDERPPSAAAVRERLRRIRAGRGLPPAAAPVPIPHNPVPATAAPIVGDRSDADRARPRRGRGPLVALVAVAAAGVGAAAAVTARDTSGGPGVAAATTPVTTTVVATVPPITADPREPRSIRTVRAFDPPPGDGREWSERAALAVDDDPASAWTTERYAQRDFPTKAGVGLVVELTDGVGAAEIELRTDNRGWQVAVHAADEPAGDLDGWGAPLTVWTASSATERIGIDAGGRRHLLVWFLDLGEAAADGRHRVSVADLRVWAPVPTREAE
jgi:hypothetical protein